MKILKGLIIMTAAIVAYTVLKIKDYESKGYKRFTVKEFGLSFPFMNDKTLAKLNSIQWPYPIYISPDKDSLARIYPTENSAANSAHYIVPGMTRAADLKPAGIVSNEDIFKFINALREAGFTGVGVYRYPESIIFHADDKHDQYTAWSGVYVQVTGKVEYNGIQVVKDWKL
jgi:hypothetical protein